MLKKAVTLPAHALRVDFFNCGFVAADAVGLHHFFPMRRKRDGFWHPAGIKHNHVFHAVDGFPDVVGAHIFMGKMTINTFDAAMRTRMKPGFKLGLHDMAGSAEVRGFSFGHEFGGAEHHDPPPAAARITIAKMIFGNLGDMRWPPSILSEADLYRRQHTVRKTAKAKK